MNSRTKVQTALADVWADRESWAIIRDDSKDSRTSVQNVVAHSTVVVHGVTTDTMAQNTGMANR